MTRFSLGISNKVVSSTSSTSSSSLIYLWSCRRVLSTPLLRAISQLDGVKPFLEPFVLNFYFGDRRRSVQFEERQELGDVWDHIPTDAECIANITADYSSEGIHTIFVKEHAQHVYPDKVPHDILCKAANTFIIRNPSKSIKSLYRQTLADFNESFWDRLVPEEVGYEE